MTVDQLHTEVKYQPCPQCQKSLPVYIGYKTWCDQCGWNLDTPTKPEHQPLFQKLYASISRKSSQHLFEDMMMKGGPLRVVFTPARLLAFLVASCVHGVTLLLIALGIWLCLAAFPSFRFLGLLLGGFCLFMVWLFLLPRPPKGSATPIAREQAPTMYQVTQRIAQALSSSPVDSIRCDVTYNAAFGQFGWRRKRWLILGVPLLSVLNEQELVALLSHELAHSVNGDPSRGFLLGTALYSLASWYELLHPRTRWHIHAGCAQPLLFAINIISLPIAGLIWVIGYVLSHLLWYDTQRAEYLADWLAAQVSGTDGILAVLDKTQLRDTFENTLRVAYLKNRMGSFFADLKRRIGQVPPREIERIRRIEKLVGSRIDSSHPPTVYRIEFLKAHCFSEAQVVLSLSEFAQLRQELEPLLQNTQRGISELDEITFREVFGVDW
jgi:heat shock protein HtpX